MPLHVPDTPSRGGFEACPFISLFGRLWSKPSCCCTLVFSDSLCCELGGWTWIWLHYYVPGIVLGALHVLTHLIWWGSYSPLPPPLPAPNPGEKREVQRGWFAPSGKAGKAGCLAPDPGHSFTALASKKELPNEPIDWFTSSCVFCLKDVLSLEGTQYKYLEN